MANRTNSWTRAAGEWFVGFVTVFIFGSLVSSCSVSRTQVQHPAGEQVPEAVASPSPELAEVTRLGSFVVRHVSKEPVELLSVRTLDRQKGLVINFENVSGQEIKVVEYGISRHEKCAEYMYVFTPNPRMIYGDDEGEIPIGPGKKSSLRVAASNELAKLLDSRTYASCSGDNRSPILMLEQVRFSDGNIWQPRARAF